MLKKFSQIFTFATNVKIKLPQVQAYKLNPKLIPIQTQITRDDILTFYKDMETIRIMENNCIPLFKLHKIKGFCHLYSGQQAIAQGINAAITYDDPLISSYRIHFPAFLRGHSVRKIMAELFGKSNGASLGHGGSMHMYNKSTNFYGGHGIVGAQISVGTGIAFALKYSKKKNVSIIMFGDGAANQGQLMQSANFAKLFSLPALFVCQNNKIGMGTTIQRSSMNPLFYTRGDHIPGIRADGNNVFAVRQVIKFAKNYSIQNGPLFLQFMTYRYSGHQLTDDGSTYRTKQQVQLHKKTSDPITKLQKIGIQNSLVSQQQLNKIKLQLESSVLHQIQQAQKDQQPNINDLTKFVYINNQNRNLLFYVDYIRGKLYQESIIPPGQKY